MFFFEGQKLVRRLRGIGESFIVKGVSSVPLHRMSQGKVAQGDAIKMPESTILCLESVAALVRFEP